MSPSLTTAPTCPRCRDTGLALAAVPADDFPYYHSGLAFALCACPAGGRLRAADRDRDAEEGMGCRGPRWAPRVAAGCEPAGIGPEDLAI